MSKATIIESPQTLLLFSYTTPVAYYNKTTQQAYVTEQKHSKTTTKHINQFFKEYVIPHYLSAFTPNKLPQEELNQLFPFSITQF